MSLNITRDAFEYAITFNHNTRTIPFNHLEGIAIPFYGYTVTGWVLVHFRARSMHFRARLSMHFRARPQIISELVPRCISEPAPRHISDALTAQSSVYRYVANLENNLAVNTLVVCFQLFVVGWSHIGDEERFLLVRIQFRMSNCINVLV